MSQPFKPVDDKALLEKLLQELLSSCDEEVAEEAATVEKAEAQTREEASARAGAARWQQAMGQPTTSTPPPASKPAGGRSLLDVRLGPPKKKP